MVFEDLGGLHRSARPDRAGFAAGGSRRATTRFRRAARYPTPTRVTLAVVPLAQGRFG
jgi:hypothetical protein